jgi:hypothetical protein
LSPGPDEYRELREAAKALLRCLEEGHVARQCLERAGLHEEAEDVSFALRRLEELHARVKQEALH